MDHHPAVGSVIPRSAPTSAEVYPFLSGYTSALAGCQLRDRRPYPEGVSREHDDGRRGLTRDETVYVDAFPIAEHLLPTGTRRTSRLRGPVGVECAPPELQAAVDGQEPSLFAGCGRGVLCRYTHASRRRAHCSRRCCDIDGNRRRKPRSAGYDIPEV